MKKKDPMWKAHQTLREKGHYKRDNSYIAVMNKSIEHRKKNSNAKIGKKNPMYGMRGKLCPRYKHGMSKEDKLEWGRFEWKNWRKKVFKRDKHICRMCGYDKGKIIQAHHIKTRKEYPKLKYVVSNGITLCRRCHETVSGNEKKYDKKLHSLLMRPDLSE